VGIERNGKLDGRKDRGKPGEECLWKTDIAESPGEEKPSAAKNR
jgi:hypothetical protein